MLSGGSEIRGGEVVKMQRAENGFGFQNHSSVQSPIRWTFYKKFTVKFTCVCTWVHVHTVLHVSTQQNTKCF
jgi:hypothetical protein